MAITAVLTMGLPLPYAMADNESGVIVAVHAGDEAILKDGRTLRLLGVKAPSIGSGILAQQSVNLLKHLAGQAPLRFDNPVIDRYGRLTAQVYLTQENGKKMWLQQEMLRQGMVFVYPPTGTEPRIDDMLAAEDEAHTQHRGIWADAAYADIPVRQAQDLYGHFSFVVGRVTRVERVRNSVTLNFGENGRKDFTVVLAAHDLKAFRRNGNDPLGYGGHTVRVRGWVKRDYGPMIAVTSPFQIQLLDQH